MLIMNLPRKNSRKMPFMITLNNQLIRISLIKDTKVIYSENIMYEKNITRHTLLVGRINKVTMILKVNNVLV